MIHTGNLRLDQKYSYISVEHLVDDYQSCEYCGTTIKNLYEIEGSDDKKHYIVGSECVVNLTMLNPLMELELKRKLRREIKFIKLLMACSYIEFYDYKGKQYFTAWESKEKRDQRWISWKVGGLYDEKVKKVFKSEAVKVNGND